MLDRSSITVWIVFLRLFSVDIVKIVKELKQGVQGFVYLGEDVATLEQVVVKQVFVEESKKPECEKVFKTWKSLSESKAKDLFVEYKGHFNEGKSTGFDC